MRKLSALHWSELRAAHKHLGVILQSTTSQVTDEQWVQLQTMRAHLSEIVDPHPSPHLHPSPTLYP